jgi:hypothetical protein
MTFNSKLIPKHLIDAYTRERCGLLVGAGASVNAGLPQWGGFLTKMVEMAQNNQTITKRKANNYIKLIKDGRYLMAASGLKSDLGSYFTEFLRRIFLDRTATPTQLHDAIVTLQLLQFVLTTNYDTLIELAYRRVDPHVTVCSFKDVGEVRHSISQREFFILKAHGDANRTGEGIILTEQDYRTILFREPAYQALLAAMFSVYTIIFIGASMTDPEINLMLNYIASTFPPDSGPTHYAAMTKEKMTEVERERWFRDFKIQIISVSSADEYAELTEFLVALGTAANTNRRSRAAIKL